MVVKKLIKTIHLKPDFVKNYNNIDVVYFAKEGYPTAFENCKNANKIDSKNINAVRQFLVVCKKWGR